MGQFIEDLQYRIKTSSGSMLLLSFKLLVVFIVGLTFALIGERMVGYGTFSFLLVIVTTMGALYRIARSWKWSQSLVFALVCVLIALLLRMYILVAPGA
jgi:hypothetical protein